MKTKIKILIGLLVISLSWSVAMGFLFGDVTRETYVAAEVEKVEVKKTVTHAQEVWINTLEWCESRGKPSAINKIDRDGTPSYGSFQFKPSTFFYYGEKYGVVKWMSTGESDEQDQKEMMAMVMDYEYQKAIVQEMVMHSKEIKWSQQFPDCVKKNGVPPVY